MVKVGDKIKVKKGLTGKVTHILTGEDGRFLIYFRNGKQPHFFIEGDEDFEVIK